MLDIWERKLAGDFTSIPNELDQINDRQDFLYQFNFKLTLNFILCIFNMNFIKDQPFDNRLKDW
jgi:hypothetical protein